MEKKELKENEVKNAQGGEAGIPEEYTCYNCHYVWYDMRRPERCPSCGSTAF